MYKADFLHAKLTFLPKISQLAKSLLVSDEPYENLSNSVANNFCILLIRRMRLTMKCNSVLEAKWSYSRNEQICQNCVLKNLRNFNRIFWEFASSALDFFINEILLLSMHIKHFQITVLTKKECVNRFTRDDIKCSKFSRHNSDEVKLRRAS